jgi:hypothetical protein
MSLPLGVPAGFCLLRKPSLADTALVAFASLLGSACGPSDSVEVVEPVVVGCSWTPSSRAGRREGACERALVEAFWAW